MAIGPMVADPARIGETLDGGRASGRPASNSADVAMVTDLRHRRGARRRREGQCGSGGEACLRVHLEMAILWEIPWALVLTMDIQR